MNKNYIYCCTKCYEPFVNVDTITNFDGRTYHMTCAQTFQIHRRDTSIPMRGTCVQFTARQLLLTRMRDMSRAVNKIWDVHVAPEKDCMKRNSVILVDMGDWYNQTAWYDEGGYFMKLRMHPMFFHQPRVKAAALAVVDAFVALLSNEKRGKKTVLYNNLHAFEGEGTTDIVTVAVVTNSTQIGD